MSYVRMNSSAAPSRATRQASVMRRDRLRFFSSGCSRRLMAGTAIRLLLMVPAALPATIAKASGEDEGGSPRLAVMPFKSAKGITQDQAQSLAGFVRDEFMSDGSFELIDREMLAERLAERDLSDAGVTELTFSGKELGAEKMVGGSVTKLGTSWSIDLRIVDVATGNLDESKSGSAEGLDELEIRVRNLARELLKKTQYADEVRNQKEFTRRRNLESKWERQKEALKVTFKKAKPEKDRKGRFYTVNLANSLNEQIKDVVIQLQSKDGTEIKSDTVRILRPNKMTGRKIRWDSKSKPAKCVIASVGGDFSRPICRPCKGNGYKNCLNCMTKGFKNCRKCQGKGTIRESYTVKEGVFTRKEFRTVECKVCHGKAREKCSPCRGIGRKGCVKCRGTGFAE